MSMASPASTVIDGNAYSRFRHPVAALPTVTLVAALRRHKARQNEARLLAGEHWEDYDLICPNIYGRPADPHNLRARFGKLAQRAGLPPQWFHDLRHGCATLPLAQGVPMRVVMGHLGHSSIGVTMNICGHVLDESKRQAMAVMDRAYGGVLGELTGGV